MKRPTGGSETLMRYFQGAPLQVLDLADGWAHVRMGMEGESLEGYIRQERLKYGAEAMREMRNTPKCRALTRTHQFMKPATNNRTLLRSVAAPGGVKIMGYNGQWAAVWGETALSP